MSTEAVAHVSVGVEPDALETYAARLSLLTSVTAQLCDILDRLETEPDTTDIVEGVVRAIRAAGAAKDDAKGRLVEAVTVRHMRPEAVR